MVSLTALSLLVSTFVGFFIRESMHELYVNLVLREFLKVRSSRAVSNASDAVRSSITLK